MSKRKIDLYVPAKCVDGRVLFVRPEVVKDWARQFDGETITVECKVVSSLNDKQQLFAYLFGPLLDVAYAELVNAGYEMIDKSEVYYLMKSLFAKEPWRNPITQVVEDRLLDFSDKNTTKEQLSKFINDIIMWLEKNLDVKAPDSDAYKVTRKYGSGFKSLKQFNKKEDEQQ